MCSHWKNSPKPNFLRIDAQIVRDRCTSHESSCSMCLREQSRNMQMRTCNLEDLCAASVHLHIYTCRRAKFLHLNLYTCKFTIVDGRYCQQRLGVHLHLHMCSCRCILYMSTTSAHHTWRQHRPQIAEEFLWQPSARLFLLRHKT